MPYTGRLANKDAGLGSFVLGRAALPMTTTPPPVSPFIDMPTALTFAPHSSSLAVFKRTTLVGLFAHTTNVVFDK